MASLALAQRLAQLRLQRGKGPGFGVDDLVSTGMTWAEAWVLRRAASPTQQGRLSGRCREVRDVGPPTARGTGALGGCLPRNEGRLGRGGRGRVVGRATPGHRVGSARRYQDGVNLAVCLGVPMCVWAVGRAGLGLGASVEPASRHCDGSRWVEGPRDRQSLCSHTALLV